jgi:hypothetical protein
MKATLLLVTDPARAHGDATGGHRQACQFAVFSGILPSMEAEIDDKMPSNSR